MNRRTLLYLFAVVLFCAPAVAHEVRPGLLQLQETEQGEFKFLWRKPVRAGQALDIEPVFPPDCRESGAPVFKQTGVYAEKRSVLTCENGLRDASLAIEGLQFLRTDVLVRVEYLGGGSETQRATPETPTVSVAGPQGLAEVSLAYLSLGIEHILLGIDHLLFVTALLMLVAGWRRLVGTVTAFTLAHSITLAGATLGILSAPPRLVEALIALSIVFVAAEVVHRQRGVTTLAIRKPWVVAFAFGLLHGFGFAGALSEVGLPGDAVPAALLFFNVGVEIGQLIFIAGALVVVQILGRIGPFRSFAWPAAIASAIGVLAAFWTFERIVAIWV